MAGHFRLAFGPGEAASLRLELLIPEDTPEERAARPRPVFMTQHTHRPWALIAVRRGYIGCVYAAADSLDDTDSFVGAYASYDWSRITRRAWAASRCVDYLAEYVPQADGERVVLTSHSRNGKLSLIAAAFDERIAAVISSSSGAGGSMSFRDYGEHHFGESVELLTRAFPDWFHPRLRFFSGREHKLPVDMHELVALCAPRPCLLSSALNDSVESAWAMQQTYLSARRVYALLGAQDQLGLLWRPGGHETWTTVIEAYLDWCDRQLGHNQGHGLAQEQRAPQALRAPARAAASVSGNPPASGHSRLGPARAGRALAACRRHSGRIPTKPTPAASSAGRDGTCCSLGWAGSTGKRRASPTTWTTCSPRWRRDRRWWSARRWTARRRWRA